MAGSILNDVKKNLGLAPDYTAFDPDVTMHINSVFSILTQLGIGPAVGYMIEDNTATWDAFIGSDATLNLVKSYMYIRVRLLFDPPATSFALAAMKAQYEEFEVRLNTQREATAWVDPSTLTIDPATGQPLPAPIPTSDENCWWES